ncbi:MAG: hypothetical protein H6624_19485 [Bdellovibrionaceae bacterium]|nr:hypothetical protein [Bdellovibrionales bacterium]MCB9086533.1 hypothetical protein [Pseudobdellovibrionaceae bacterium]
MQKISGILPNTPRIAAVDMRDGHAARPGGPTFGRPEGSSGASRRDTSVTTAQLAAQKHAEVMSGRSKVQQEAEIVRRLSDGFFMRRMSPEPDQRYDLGLSEPMEPVVSPSGQTLYQDPESGEMVEGDVMPPGSYLNVSA